MNEILTLYRDRLTDLTARNQSLRLLRMVHKNHSDIAAFSNLQEGLGERITRDILKRKGEVPILPANSFDDEGALISQRLVRLKRETDLIEQETGTNAFFVGYGFLEGYLVEDFYLRCPLLFYPVRLKKAVIRNNPHWILEADEGDAPFLNRTFLLAAQKFLGINLMDRLQEELQDLPTDENVLAFLLNLLKENHLQVKMEDSSDLLVPFKSLKRDEIPKEQQGFLLRPYCVMGKFRQSTSTLLRDYEELLQELPQEGYLHRLFNPDDDNEELEKVDTEILNRVDEKETFFVLNTDASQEAVVLASRDRQGLIVHGPPGTGKSQVIVNLIADRLAQGKRVLLVCQKPAALDVVYNRLGQIGLQQHVALVHDHNTSRSAVYSKVLNVLQRTAGSAPDHTRLSTEVQQLAEHLNRVARSLHSQRPFGKTLHQLYTSADWNTDLIFDVEDVLSEITYEHLQSLLVEMRNTFELMQKYDHPTYPWVHRKSFASFTVAQHQELQRLLQNMADDVKTGDAIRSETELHYKPQYYLENREVLQGLQQAVRILQNRNMFRHVLLYYRDEEREFETEEQMHKIKLTYGSLNKEIEHLAGRAEPLTALSEDEATSWLTKIKQFLELNDKKIGRLFSTSWYGLRKELQQHCLSNGMAFDGTSVRKYMERIQAFLQFEKLRRDALRLHFFSDAPTVNAVEEWQKWIRQKGKALEFLELFVLAQIAFPDWLENPHTMDELQRYLQPEFEKNVESVMKLVQITERMQTSATVIRKYLQDEEVTAIQQEINHGIYDQERYQSLLQTLGAFDSLCRLDQLKREMGGLQRKWIERCKKQAPIDQTPNVVDHWHCLIENSYLHAWILQIETQEPHVKDVSTEIYENNRRRHRDLLKQKRDLIPSFIDDRLARQAAEVSNRTQQLMKTQAGRKRSQMTMRQFMGTYSDELMKMFPCWLCTPEAVSAIFPLKQNFFDLVIFDEASQCPVENALPSIYRGKQVVVAGDEKQLPPTSFFRSSAEDEDDSEDGETYVDRTDTQAKSLLEWTKPRFADQWLTWHYRSKYPELIAFSNYAFYGKRMEIAPSLAYRSDSKPIEFVQVSGKWINQQNRTEAEKVVDLVIDILRNDPNAPTLGIITFNAKQTELINDVFDERASVDAEVQLLLEEARHRKNEEENVGLFVKNIENVQGDERDIILFSVAYAENEEGKMPSNFGPLSQEAGENRLNVAITRAREKVVLVCSFDPSQWTKAETYAKGVRFLKRYLEYGKAVSEGRTEAVLAILEGLRDATTVQDEHRVLHFDSPFEEQVHQALVEAGYRVNTQIGFSGYRIDLGVLNPRQEGRYILGIECDGATYHSSKVARERDFYRQRFLENKGWTIHRIWSRNWWKDPAKEMSQIKLIVDHLVQNEQTRVR